MNLRSGRTVNQANMEQNTGENTHVPQRLERGDAATGPTEGFDIAQFMQQIMAQLSGQTAEINNKILESTAETNNKIEILNDTLNNKILETTGEIKKTLGELTTENKNLREQIEQTNNNLNKKIDMIAEKLEAQIMNKVNTEIDSKVNQIQIGVDNSIKQIEGKIIDVNAQYSRNFEVLNEKIDIENEKIKEQVSKINREKTIQYVCNRVQQGEVNILFYGDRKIHPKVFIKNLREYIESLPEGVNIKANIRNSLKGDAEIWYSIVEDKYESFEEFAALFLTNYWGENHQSKIRENLFNGRYLENIGFSREKYILKKYSYVRHLEPRMPDSEIVKYFSRHFSENIRDVILIQGIDTIEKMLQYLRRIDDVKNQGRKQENEEDKQRGKEEIQNVKREMERNNYIKNRYEQNRNYTYNKRYDDRYNRNYEYRGNGRPRSEEYQSNRQGSRNDDEQQNTQVNRQNENQKRENKEETKKTEWNRMNEITTAIVETGPKSQNF